MAIPIPPTLSDIAVWESLPDGGRSAIEEMGIGDGLPVRPISVAEATSALFELGLGADDEVALIPPLSRPATAISVAACALLAGCDPEDLPVVVAAVRAVSDGAFNGLGVFTTTGSAAALVIVNGPVSTRFNSAGNLLGPGHRVNATVGRAVSLCIHVIGGAVPGLTDMASMGQPGKYTFCFAENEAASPWEPLHVANGLRASDSAVTVFAASGTIEVTNSHAVTADDVLDTVAACLFQPGSLDPDRGLLGGGRHLILLTPEWAEKLATEGMSRERVASELCHRATWPAATLPRSLRRTLPADAAATIRAADAPEHLLVAVAGGTGIKQTIIPCWPGGSAPVTAKIEHAHRAV